MTAGAGRGTPFLIQERTQHQQSELMAEQQQHPVMGMGLGMGNGQAEAGLPDGQGGRAAAKEGSHPHDFKYLMPSQVWSRRTEADITQALVESL